MINLHTVYRTTELLGVPVANVIHRRNNAWRACLGKVVRQQYLLRYPVRVIRSDGSTIEIKAAEPRQIVQLPVDLKMLSDDERRQRLAARKPKAKKIIHEVIDDSFKADDYMKLFTQKQNK